MGKLVRNDHRRQTPEERLRATIQQRAARQHQAGATVTGAPRNAMPSSHVRMLQARNQAREATLPPEDIVPAQHILVTGGIGDFLVLESHMEPARREAIQHVTLATRADKSIRDLLDIYPAFPNLKVISSVQVDWSKVFCFVQKGELETYDLADLNLEEIQDWSIYIRFPFIQRGILTYQKSSYVANKIADVGRLNLPPNYVVCNPYSPNDRRMGRDFTEGDWRFAIAEARNFGWPLVVVNVSDDFIPDEPDVINLNKKTSLAESIEVVKGASKYIGIDSCLSIIAAQSLAGEKLRIKSNNGHLYNYQSIYYAPHKHFTFIQESF